MIGDIDPKIYGNFIEHLGRCIEGGVFDEKSPLSDSNGFRRDVLDASKKLDVSILRWPGGSYPSIIPAGDQTDRPFPPLVRAERNGKSGQLVIFFAPTGDTPSINARSAQITSLLKAWRSGAEGALARPVEDMTPSRWMG